MCMTLDLIKYPDRFCPFCIDHDDILYRTSNNRTMSTFTYIVCHYEDFQEQSLKHWTNPITSPAICSCDVSSRNLPIENSRIYGLECPCCEMKRIQFLNTRTRIINPIKTAERSTSINRLSIFRILYNVLGLLCRLGFGIGWKRIVVYHNGINPTFQWWDWKYYSFERKSTLHLKPHRRNNQMENRRKQIRKFQMTQQWSVMQEELWSFVAWAWIRHGCKIDTNHHTHQYARKGWSLTRS